jgi:transposase
MDILSLKNKDKKELIDIILSLNTKVVEQEETIEQLLEQLNLYRNEKFGNKSEKSKDLSILDEADVLSGEDIEEAEETIVSSHTRKITKKKDKKTGRKPLPENLPREIREYDLAEEDKICSCGSHLICIGEERTEQLEIEPAKLYVIVHVAKKYACKCCEETIKQADKPKQPISRGLAGAGLLAHIIVSKFQDHLPLYRLENIFRRIGVDIPRATLSYWVIKCYQLLLPLYVLMLSNIKEYYIAYSDESPLQVLNEPGRKAQNKSYMWCVAGGADDKFCYAYHYSPTRSHKVIIELLGGFAGYLHCDGYPGYDTYAEAIKKEYGLEVKQIGCWYHCRRKFVDAAKVSKKAGLANWMIKKISKLSKIEAEIKDNKFSAQEAYNIRQEKAKPILEEIKNWLDSNISKVLPKTLIGKAFNYTSNQWPKLINYLLDGNLENNNNRMERIMKPFATGKKNWLFAYSIDGAKAAAILLSFIETCKYHKIDPFSWFKYVLSNIHNYNSDNLHELLPYNIDVNKLFVSQ